MLIILSFTALIGFPLAFVGFAGIEDDNDHPVLGLIGAGLCLTGIVGLMYLSM